jgi:hypothetical protein
MINKTIWILWFQGWDTAPEIYKQCRNSWIKNNPTWNVVSLDENNIDTYINVNKYLDLDKKQITLTKRSNFIRLNLLLTYGGIWVDASTYCYTPLDDWLPTNQGFFAFNKPAGDRPLSNWLIYAEKDNLILLALSYNYFKWWSKHDSSDDYFLFHHVFRQMLKNNKQVKKSWSKVKKISARSPHSVMPRADLQATSQNLTKVKLAPVYKLNIKISDELIPNSILDACIKGKLHQLICNRAF